MYENLLNKVRNSFGCIRGEEFRKRSLFNYLFWENLLSSDF